MMMKRTGRGAAGLAVVATLAATGAACGVPDPVRQAFAARYPAAEGVAWESQRYGWEAVFHDGDSYQLEYEAEFDQQGRWLETETEVYQGAGFPDAARTALVAATRGAFISKWEIEETPAGRFYEVETAGSDGEWYVDAQGRPAANQYEDA